VPAAEFLPSFQDPGLPVSLLVDYDRTISLIDIGDAMLARHVADYSAVARIDADYDAGIVGSRELLQWDMDMLPDDPAQLRAESAAIPQDETFPVLVGWAQEHGAAMEIVSDGLGFYIDPNLARLGVTLPVATNHNPISGGGAGMRFPYGHPRCFVCGTCKRERVLLHRVAGRVVVFVGDGMSDRYAAAHSDIVFAKDRLKTICADEGWPSVHWDDFSDVVRWLDGALAAGALPRSREEVPAWRRGADAGDRPYICGPEVWGDGRRVLPARTAVD
jgi:2-hydroxy-3-keto-5-methylthiopentenyl-1-phosphate phosphatase